MLSEQRCAEFADRGIICLRGAFTGEDAARMRRRVWARLSRFGVREDDPSTWSAMVLTGLSKSIKRDAVFTAAGSPAVTGAVDHLLGLREWTRPPDWGTILVTFPQPGQPWALPAKSWHTDYGFDLDPLPLFGVKVFAFISDVGPRSGGTLAIAGSHRVVARYARSNPPDYHRDRHVMERFLRHDDWFRALSRPGGETGRTERFLDRDHQADGITVRVTELTGKPGDVVLTHPWVLHSGAPNTGSYPRMMLTKNLYRRGMFRRPRQRGQDA